MSAIPKKAEARIRNGIKQFQKVLEGAKNRDVNESDTVTIINDILSDVCGYDKYTEVTREYAIRGTYCDLAIKLDDKPVFLVEVKAIGLALKEIHLRQAINYAANSGIEWVILTNGDHWQAYRVVFEKPVKTEVAFDFKMLEITRPVELVDFFFLISKEGVKKSAIDIFHKECQLTSRYMIAAALQTEPVLTAIRKTLKSNNRKVKITNEAISQTIQHQVLKREVIEGEEAKKSKKCLAKKTTRKIVKKTAPEPNEVVRDIANENA